MIVSCIIFISVIVSTVILAQSDIKDAQVIICAIAKNEEPYVDEWIRYHQYLGFDHVYLHDNDIEPSMYVAGLPEIYGDFVKVMRHPGLAQQRAAYKVCLEEYRNSNTWAAFMDVDEYIVLRKHENIKDFLRDIAPNGGSVVLNWARFSNNGAEKREDVPLVTRFTYTTMALNRHIKTIAYLPHTKYADVHNSQMHRGHQTLDVQGRPQLDYVPFMEDNDGNKNIAYINHYHTKSLEELVLKRRRGYADLPEGGVLETQAQVMEQFQEYNRPHHQVEETFARDFYLRHWLGDVQLDSPLLTHILKQSA